jgi:hypothetical protein
VVSDTTNRKKDLLTITKTGRAFYEHEHGCRIATGNDAWTAAKAEMTIERGEYLVTTIGACDNCHTRRIDSVFGGKVVPGAELSGGFEFSDPDIGPIVSPNITPDVATGIGEWTNAQIVNALRNADPGLW